MITVFREPTEVHGLAAGGPVAWGEGDCLRIFCGWPSSLGRGGFKNKLGEIFGREKKVVRRWWFARLRWKTQLLFEIEVVLE